MYGQWIRTFLIIYEMVCHVESSGQLKKTIECEIAYKCADVEFAWITWTYCVCKTT